MADQVEIILRGSSKQLEATLARIDAGLKRVGASSATTQQTLQTNTQRTSRSINNQNKSLTLLVAKFALLAFAIQTVANIFNSTFGAALRSIDDFQVAAIGTATAVTSIADVSEDALGDAFNQNLNAALVTFEELELVAARFFSTGQELQLAFNTFAQRGVVIREEEFDILGKITDQVKLLTGGQNTQIQIQQEIRAILDGNVRTTTAFGKALQARGVDIQQLSREVRATGSIAPFEQFLTGLDAAGPAIRRTLSSVTATFTSLARILNRRIFQDTFDTVVAQITDINNAIINNLDLIVAVGKKIKTDIGAGFKDVLTTVNEVGGRLLKLATSDAGKVLAAILLINKAFKLGPLGALFAIASAITLLTGKSKVFGLVISIVFGTLEAVLNLSVVLIDKLVTQVDRLIEASSDLIDVASGFEGFTITDFVTETELSGTVDAIEKQQKRLFQILEERKELVKDFEEIFQPTPVQVQAFRTDSDELSSNEAEVRQNLTRLFKNRQDLIERLGRDTTTGAPLSEVAKDALDPGEAGKEAQSKFVTFLETIDGKLKEFNKSTTGEVKTLTEQFADLAKSLAKDIKIISTGGEGGFTRIVPRVFSDTRVEEAQLKLERAGEDARIKATLDRVEQQEKIELASLQKRFEAEELTATELFNAQNALRARSLENDTQANQAALRLIDRRLEEDLAIIKRNEDADDGLTKIATKEEAQLKRLGLIAAAEKEIGALKLQGNQIPANIEKERLRITEELLKAQRQITDELRKQQETINRAFGSETNEQRAARTQAAAEEETTRFRRQNPGATNQQIIDNALGANLLRTQENFKVQIQAFINAIDAVFNTLIDGIVEGSFDFRDAAKNISKDLIKAGLDGLITQVKDTVVKGLTGLFENIGQRAAQAATLALGLLLAILSRIGSKGDFTATGGDGGGLSTTGAPVRGLIGGDTSLPIAEINNGLQEALIPTNAILSQIEFNTRGLAGLNVGIDPNALAQAVTAQVQGLFSQALLQT
jgi:hypothetical protein